MTEEREMTAPMTSVGAEVGQSKNLHSYLKAFSNSSSE